MKRLTSFLGGAWVDGVGEGRPLVSAVTGKTVAVASTEGLDLAAAMAFGRDVGGPALRDMTFAQRGQMLKALSSIIYKHREELLLLSTENGGTTRKDGKFDVDGASGTLAWYAALGKRLGDRKVLTDGEQLSVLQSKRFVGQHFLVPRRGVAVHLNAFNFPAWGMAEKAAVALLAGMPVLSKPGTPTALMAHRIAQLFDESGALPKGAFQFLCGSAQDLLDHCGPQDCVAFTGGTVTARKVRSHPALIEHNVRVNIEADSLNAAILGPNVEPGDDTFNMFIKQVVTDLTQKCGQKCTATRRIFVPLALVDEVCEALTDRLDGIVVGDPAAKGTDIAPASSPSAQKSVVEGTAELAKTCTKVWSAASPAGDGCYVSPALFRTDAGRDAVFVHSHEVFGPVATICTWDGSADGLTSLVALGGGGLVCSFFSDDLGFARQVLPAIAAWHGRVLWGSRKVADLSPGAGTVLPDFVHGGPGKAGGGEELGGERGLSFYSQRVAIQADRGLIDKLFAEQ